MRRQLVVLKSALKSRRGNWRCQRGRPSGFATTLEHHDIEMLPLTLEVCVHSTELPKIHADPCDRMIIATAQLHSWPVVTADPVFARYGVEILT